MSECIDELLKLLPAPSVDHALDQLEPAVWRRIEANRSVGATDGGLRLQLVAACMALAVGLVLGWSMSNHAPQSGYGSSLYASYAAVGPMGRLENGL